MAPLEDLHSTTAVVAASPPGAVLPAQTAAAQASTVSATPTTDYSAGFSKQTRDTGTGRQFSLIIFIIAIVATAVGACLLSLLGFYLFSRRRKAKRRADEAEKEANAALDRAIVSYIVKDQPSPAGSAAQVPPQQDGPGPAAMTPALGAKMGSHEPHGPPHTPSGPARPVFGRIQSLRRTESTASDSRLSSGRTSSPLTPSVERVYAAILARPLEYVRTRNSSRLAEPGLAVRDDVGWPLPSTGSWV
ncbi:hypothetical protein N658DRAFT_511623 [Parathielavia hyrcaniae]|uniref:Transmembrane protein n=1 Tax=Parathielavia hyrcaniae TaxID=113614 RepID=A0AAN6SWI3_9PEZI|nr:hypothetical protein N658DRAFT_511623 [Parathielavia hyrcaniae]